MTFQLDGRLYDADGRLHQPSAAAGELKDLEDVAPTVGTSSIGVYDVGLFTFDRPNIATTGFAMYRPRGILRVLKLILRIGPEAWAAAGAVSVAIGNAADRSWFVADLLATPPDSGWGDLTISPDDPLLVTVFGSPTAGMASVSMFAADGRIYPNLDLVNLSYYG